MKKGFLAICFVGFVLAGNSQELGIRIGNVVGSNVAIDGVFSVGKFSRVHGNLSFGDKAVGLEAIYDFLYKPLDGEAFHWYVGAGPSLRIGDPFRIGASAEAGLQYNFNQIPISLSADWRPTFWIVENTEFSARGFGFNIRYVFGNKK